ncbi:MAG: hypothetical protein P1P84_25965, partial [Deferrisomatales bacterium]|nr:hypothetical protein [Deferrisomatales bacterium]
PGTGDVMAGHRERVLTETTGDPSAGVTTVQRTPITEFELFRQSRSGAVSDDFDNRHTFHAGVTHEGSLTTGNIDRWWGRDIATGVSIGDKSLEEALGLMGKITLGGRLAPQGGGRFFGGSRSPAPIGSPPPDVPSFSPIDLPIRGGLPPGLGPP